MDFINKAKSFSENAAKKAKEFSSQATEKASDLADNAKIKHKISVLNSEIKRKYEQIGLTVYEGLLNDSDCEETIAKYCQAITDMKEEIKQLEKLI